MSPAASPAVSPAVSSPGPLDGPTAPLAALLPAALADPGLQDVVAAAGRDVAVEGPTGLRPFLAAALAAAPGEGGAIGGAGAPVLVVTATEREAEELTTAVGELLSPDEVALLPSWETLPHERLSPRADTVGRRVSVMRRLAHPEAPDTPDVPLRVVVTATRSLIQPVVPGLGDLEPVRLAEGTEYELEALTARLVDLAYARVEMVEKRGEFAVRGGIVDLFPPTAAAPVRVEFWGDEVSELRCFSVADQRSLPGDGPDARPAEVVAPPCRELLLTDTVRARAAELAAEHTKDKALAELLSRVAEGIPSEGMESLIPALLSGEGGDARARPGARAAAQRRARAGLPPRARDHPRRRPRAHRPGVPRGVVARGRGRRRRSRPHRPRCLGLPRPRRRARRRGEGGAAVVDAVEPRDRPRRRGRLPHP